jgi:hypothetical protein
MFERFAWGFSRVAFDVSRDECVPDVVRGVFQRLGTMGFCVALALQGRALSAVCEGMSGWRERTALAALMTRVRTQCHLQLRRLEVGMSTPCESEPRSVPAWSLPNVAQLRSLGLGDVWAVRCPFCRGFHTHVPGEACRRAGCSHGSDAETYELVYAGELPRALHEPLRRDVRASWPRLLLDWPQHEADAAPFLLKAA